MPLKFCAGWRGRRPSVRQEASVPGELGAGAAVDDQRVEGYSVGADPVRGQRDPARVPMCLALHCHSGMIIVSDLWKMSPK